VLVLSFSLLTKVDLACLPARLVATEAEDRLSFRHREKLETSARCILKASHPGVKMKEPPGVPDASR